MTSWLGKKRPSEWAGFFNDHHKAKVRKGAHSMRPIHAEGVKSMTKLEGRYANKLDLLKHAGEIVDWRFEPLNFRLAKRTWYKPDFLLIYLDRFEVHEVKGHWEDDARVKAKVAAELYPWFHWVAVTAEKGIWRYEHFGGLLDG